MVDLLITEEELVKKEKLYLSNLLKREPTKDELLEFQTSLSSLGSALYRFSLLRQKRREND
jgi:hypothetical protein